ncbi:MAG: GNAT family N-acetyltransferase [bacterium]|nr:GNAT family N-acetyltransferase [bacterium]
MDLPLDLSIESLEGQLYLGHINSPCSYLPGRDSSLMFLDGRGIGQLYRLMLDRGYRRHGNHLYRPDCGACSECQVLRIPTEDFAPTRSQRRVFKRGQSAFRYEVGPTEYTPEKLALYERYLAHQHARPPVAPQQQSDDPSAHADAASAGSEPESDAKASANANGEGSLSENSYREFFVDSFLGAGTSELRLYVDDRLAGVAILDRAGDALSAVYFYFEPDFARLSPGTYAILLELELAREWGLKWFYPGYFIRDCPAMSYKQNFGPHEIRVPGESVWKASKRT